ncbi:hypothetical protein PS1_034670 [Malus domestica]
MGVVDFLEGWQRLVEQLGKEEDDDSLLQHVVFGFWQIWKCRNEAIFNRTRILPHTAVELWRKQVEEFREAAVVVWGKQWDRELRVLRDFAGIPKLTGWVGGGRFAAAIMAEVESIKQGMEMVLSSVVMDPGVRLVVESNSK